MTNAAVMDRNFSLDPLPHLRERPALVWAGHRDGIWTLPRRVPMSRLGQNADMGVRP